MKAQLKILLLIISLPLYLKAEQVNLFEVTKQLVANPKQVDDYDRIIDFGPWVKQSSSCLDTRNYILYSQSGVQPEFQSSNRCKVSQGLWNSPYSEEYFTKSNEVQIDHLIPLKEAYLSGAYKWSVAKRCHFANFLDYPYHLVISSARDNQSKSDREPSDFLPSNSNFRCEYLKHWLMIKSIWKLSLDVKEYNSIIDLYYLNHCNIDLFIIDSEIIDQLKTQSNTPSEPCVLRGMNSKN